MEEIGNFMLISQCNLDMGVICNNVFDNIPVYSEEQLNSVMPSILDKTDELCEEKDMIPIQGRRILVQRTIEAYKKAAVENNKKTVRVANGCCNHKSCPKRLYVKAVLLAISQLSDK